MMRSTTTIALVAFFALSAQAEPVTDVEINGDAMNRVDIIFLGDGYIDTELADYAADVSAAMDYFFSEEPFVEYRSYINVRRIEVISNESGADHPENNDFKDTALGATYNCAGIQRLICVDFTAVNNVLNASVSADERDIVVILVNDDEYGGSGGAFAVASTNQFSADIAMHEIGHSFAFLGDEYETSPPVCNTAVEPSAANLTTETDRNLIKWNAGGGPPTGWIDPSTPVPHVNGSSLDEPGLFDGGGYCVAGEGMYRPTFNSKMRSLGVPFGPINSEQFIKRMYDFTYPVESQLPAAEVQQIQFGDSQNYSISLIQPATHTLETFWYLDLVLQTTGGESFSLTSADLTPGPHQVFVWAHDNTPMVRNDPDQKLWGFAMWTVYVASSGDRDGDGVADDEDAFPDDPLEQSDFDGDLTGDNADTDDDNDTVADSSDAFPFDPREWNDTDGDGIGDNVDEASSAQIALFGIDLVQAILSVVDATTGQEQAFFDVTLEGAAMNRRSGLAVDPNTLQMYAIGLIIGQAGDGRNLLRIDPNSGTAVNVGNTGQPIAALTFDDQGVLYGVSGDCANCTDPNAIPEALFTIDPNTAQATLVQQLGNGDSGESIAFNPDDGMIYHASGKGANLVFEKIDPSNGTVTNVPISGDSLQNRVIMGMAYDVLNQRFVGSAYDSSIPERDYFYISASGVVTVVDDLQFIWKDFAFWNLGWASYTDIDLDGFPDYIDVFPTDSSEWADLDGDGTGNNSDALPSDPNETADNDGDGIGDNADPDDDNDNVPDVSDAFPFDPTESVDTDGDGFGDNSDQFPNDPAEWLDTDGDGTGNNADTDDDGDGVPDVSDNYPLGQFDDAPSGSFAFSFIEALARAGITAGCGNNNYCPDATVTRAQMAVFLERGINGSGYSPPAASGTLFLDVGAGDFAASFIEQLAADGITAGCGNGNYCPDAVVTRAQMAVFLLRAKYGAGYSPPAPSGIFNDAPLGSFAVNFIEQLAAEGITAGCGNNNYCPNDPVTRAQMAVFLVRTFGL